METEDLEPIPTVWLQIFLSLFPRSKSAVTAVSNLAHSDSPWNADASSEMSQAPIAASLSSDLGSLKKKNLFPLQRLGWTVVTVRLRRTAVSLVSPFYPPSLSFPSPLSALHHHRYWKYNLPPRHIIYRNEYKVINNIRKCTYPSITGLSYNPFHFVVFQPLITGTYTITS